MGLWTWLRERRDTVPDRKLKPPQDRDRKVDVPRAQPPPARRRVDPSEGLGLRPPPLPPLPESTRKRLEQKAQRARDAEWRDTRERRNDDRRR